MTRYEPVDSRDAHWVDDRGFGEIRYAAIRDSEDKPETPSREEIEAEARLDAYYRRQREETN